MYAWWPNSANRLQFKKSNDALNAVFAILAAIGFSSAMGACFFLNKQTELRNDLWFVAQKHDAGPN